MGRYWRRLAQPLSAAIIFCALGLTSAVLVLTFNRGVASQAPQQLPVVASAPTASPSQSPAPTPTPTPADACHSTNRQTGPLAGDTVTQDAFVQITDGSQTLSIGIPAGIAVSGSSDDITLSASIPQTAVRPVTGTVVSDTTLCVVTSHGAGIVVIAGGSSASGQMVSSARGLLVTGVEFKAAAAAPQQQQQQQQPPAAPPPGPGGGGGGDQGG